jgi:hypothetical protein
LLPSDWPLAPRTVLAINVPVTNNTDVVNGDISNSINLNAAPGPDGISLREAMLAANNSGGGDTITFSIGTGAQTITLTSGSLPNMNRSVVIDGSTQPGFTGTPLIEINGNGTIGNGFTLQGGGSVVRSLIINRFTGSGITFQNGNHLVAGNYIGLNAAGTAAQANGGSGVEFHGGVNNTVGGLTAADRNVISGNLQHGVRCDDATRTVIVGNYIGTNAAGSAAVGNGSTGIIVNAAGQKIGGGASGARNVISGNGSVAVLVLNSSGASNRIQGNYIGTDATGMSAIPNQIGVVVGDDITPLGNADNFIGTDSDGLNDATEANVISGNTLDGVTLTQAGSSNNRVSGNFIGTNASGTSALGNGREGIAVRNGASTNIIGTNADGVSDVLERNIISGNAGHGVFITDAGSNGNLVRGNRIGTNAAGTSAVGNTGSGINVNAPNNTIGSALTGAGNLISGNGQNGVLLNSSGVGTQVLGNHIGTDVTGAAALPNAQRGIRNLSFNSVIGGILVGERNTIAFNTLSGITSAGIATGSRFLSNSIFSNGALGIDLGPDDGVTPNDPGDGDTGPNRLQNFPVITDARTGTNVIQFTLNSTASSSFRIEFFSSAMPDPTAFGEGQTFLGSTIVATDGTGNFTGMFTSPTALAAGQVVSATATNVATSDTSEFSKTRIVLAPTAVKFVEATAVRRNNSVLLRWRTGMEVDNLGFNIYRDDNGHKTQLTRQLVAGSALFAGKGSVLTAGNGYRWLDKQAAAGGSYWIEDIDLNGERTLHGPIVPLEVFDEIGSESSPLLSELAADEVDLGSTQRELMPPALGGIRKREALRLEKSSGIKPSSALTSLAAVKFSVNRDGWYRVTQPELVAAGLNPNTDARLLQLFADGIEVPIRLSTTGAQLNSNDTLEFYGQALDLPTTDTRSYYLVTGSSAGKRIPLVAAEKGKLKAEESVSSFTATIEREENAVYFSSLLNGEEENIFGPVVGNTTVTQTLFLQSLAGPSANDSLEVALQGLTERPHSVRVALNGTEVGLVEFTGREHRSSTLTIPSGVLREGENNVALTSTASTTDISLLDYLRVTFQKQYRASENRLLFSVPAGRQLSVKGFTTPALRLFDIIDPRAPIELGAVIAKAGSVGYVLNIAPSATPRTLLALPNDAFSPSRVEAKAASNLSSSEHSADLLILTYGQFRSSAETLAAWRRAQGLAVEVADIDSVFDEFSNGTHTPLAVKDFLQWTFDHWQRAPRYVLLLGDSSWDPRNYLGQGPADFVPTRLVDTQNMETASDDWLGDFNSDGVPEIAIGRLPVRTAAQAETIVAKLMAYDQAPLDPSRGALMVADRTFEMMSSSLHAFLPPTMPVTTINRGADDAATRANILSGLNSGPGLVSFAGHGSVTVWTGAGLLRADDALLLTNHGRLPVMVSLTCLNNYAHDASIQSLGEAMVLAPTNGAIASWSSSGMTVPDAQEAMGQSFYSVLFSGSNVRLGDAIVAAKAATSDTDVRNTWVLLGDPSMRLR